MLKKEYPLDMKSKDLKIDTMNCTLSTLVRNGMIETEMKEYLGTGAAPSATFKAPDVEALNITSPEESPEQDKLVKAMGI